MLKISTIDSGGDSAILHLDGQISGRWVGLLEVTCDSFLHRGIQLTVDLSHVSFSDRDGIALLRRLELRQVTILNPLPFIAEQIKSAAP